MALSKIGTPEESGEEDSRAPDESQLFCWKGQCWKTWDTLRIQHNHMIEETLGEFDSTLQLRVVDLESDTERFAFYQEAVMETAACIVASAGVLRLTYRRCYLNHRRELLILKRLSKTPTLVEFFRAVSTKIDDEQLPTPTTNKQRSDLKLFCLDLLKKTNPATTTTTNELTTTERLAIAISLGRESHLCPCCKPGKIAFPKASWDWLDDDVEELSYEAFCSQDCLKQYRPKYCPKCFRSDQLLDVQSTLFPHRPHRAKPQPILRCTRCGVYERCAGHPDDPAIALREKKMQIRSMRSPAQY